MSRPKRAPDERGWTWWFGRTWYVKPPNGKTVRCDGVTWPPQTLWLTTDSDSSLFPLLLFGVLETWSSFEGHRRRGSVQEWMNSRIVSRLKSLASLNHILVYLPCYAHARSGTPDFSPFFTPTKHASSEWASGSSHLPYPGPVLLSDIPLPAHIFTSPTPFILSPHRGRPPSIMCGHVRSSWGGSGGCCNLSPRALQQPDTFEGLCPGRAPP